MKNNHGSTIDPQHGPRPITPSNLLEINKRFMGGGMSQSYAAIYIFEHYIQLNDFDYVVEIGSQKGALSLYLANMACSTERFILHTYEIDKQKDWYSRPNEGVGHWFEKIAGISQLVDSFEDNIFSTDAQTRITETMVDKKTLIFCDGGDKLLEFKIYAPFIKKGDRIMVHDWGHEIGHQHVEPTMTQENITFDHPFSEWCTQLQTQLMPFKKH